MKRKMQLLTTAVSLIASMIGVIFCTFAWFTVNKIADASTSIISVTQDNMSIDYDIYKYDKENDVATTVDGNGDKLLLSGITLNQYDAVFKDQNRYAALIVRLSITGSSVSSAGSIGLRFERDTSITAASSTTVLADYMSNMIDVSCAVGSAYSGTTATELYNNSYDTFNLAANLANFQAFTTGTVNNYVKATSISFDVSYASTDWTSSTLYVYIFLSYKEALADAYVDAHEEEISSTITTGYDLPIANDLSFIYVSHS